MQPDNVTKVTVASLRGGKGECQGQNGRESNAWLRSFTPLFTSTFMVLSCIQHGPAPFGRQVIYFE